MTREQARQVMDQLGDGVESGPLGITWGPIRCYCGGGIAGNSHEWWIDFPGFPDAKRLGPFTTQHQLRQGLRRYIIKSLKMMIAISDMIGEDEL